MTPEQIDQLCAGLDIIARDEDQSQVALAVRWQLAELELIRWDDGRWKLTSAGERLFTKIESGADIKEAA